ncbi:CRTAC1 family protein [Candidatus Poribacteria bacterium]|nr:CRTAC1 family protein [Candidatus Poribacteria bacterium]
MGRAAGYSLSSALSVLWLLGVSPVPTDARSFPTFVDATDESGIDFRHFDGRTGRKYLPETLGSGAAFFDYDGDGWLDLYVVNGADLPGSSTFPPPTNRLYRNLGDGTFADVTASSGTGDTGYGFGCAVADYDNDGDLDLYVTNLGRNVLYRNNGDGTFSDVSSFAGVADDRWSTSAAFGDYDGDGWLDLFVVNYMRYEFHGTAAAMIAGQPTYRSPVDQLPGSEFVPESPVLYRNNHDGTFTDVTDTAGVNRPGIGLAVAVGDYDNDDDPDIAVANDMERDTLYRNNGDGTFADMTMTAGTGYDENGIPGSGMGASFGDYDNDGDLDLLVSNASSMPAILYRNDGDGMFTDVGWQSGVAVATLPWFKWSAEWFDADLDGWLDILVVNGHLQDNIAEFTDQQYAQRLTLLRNRGDGTFSDVAREAGLLALPPTVGRGAALGDYDNDGDTDVFVVNSNAPPTLLRNDGSDASEWLMVRVVGTAERTADGARVTVTAGGITQTREARGVGSYLSARDDRLLFGLGDNRVASVAIRFPDISTAQASDVPSRHLVEFVRGAGSRVTELRAVRRKTR